MKNNDVRASAELLYDTGLTNAWDIAARLGFGVDGTKTTPAKRVHDRLDSRTYRRGRLASEAKSTITTPEGLALFNTWFGLEGETQEQPIYDVDTPIPPPDLGVRVQTLTEVNSRLFKQLAAVKHHQADLREAVLVAAADASLSLGPIGPTPPSLRNVQSMTHVPEVALWHMTDWQGGKETTSYNSDVMFERALRFCEKAVKITNIQRADHPVSECVLCFGGDMIEGLFQFPTQPYEVDATLFDQFVRVSRLLVQVVQFALAAYESVTVIAEWGNHGRIGSKRDAIPRGDNFDRMCYELARSLLSGEDRLTWEDCPEDVQRLEIGNYRALLIHGDEIGRMGFASLNTILQHVNRWKSGAYPWDFRDVYHGHYHVHHELPMANGQGSLFGTGSLESDNRYAREMLASAATPTQRLHFIDPERGRVSAQYKIYVDRD